MPCCFLSKPFSSPSLDTHTHKNTLTHTRTHSHTHTQNKESAGVPCLGVRERNKIRKGQGRREKFCKWRALPTIPTPTPFPGYKSYLNSPDRKVLLLLRLYSTICAVFRSFSVSHTTLVFASFLQSTVVSPRPTLTWVPRLSWCLQQFVQVRKIY